MSRQFGLSSRRMLDGGTNTSGGSRGVTQYYADNALPLPATTSLPANSQGFGPELSIPRPSGSIASPVPALKSLNLAQALIDGVAMVFGLFFLTALIASLPLAIALMVLGVL